MKINHQDIHSTRTDDTDCPSPEALLRFTDRALRLMGTSDVPSHLDECDSCAELAGLMGLSAAGSVPPDLSPAERRQDREMVAQSLGFEKKRSLIQKLLGLADSLWQIKTPILVPVSTTALLLFVLLPLSGPAAIKEAASPVHHFSDVTRLTITDLNLRNSGEETSHHAAADSLVILTYHATGSALTTGAPVSVIVTSRTHESMVLSSSVSDDGKIEVPLIFFRPGHFQVHLHMEDGEDNRTLLDVVHFNVTTPPTPAN